MAGLALAALAAWATPTALPPGAAGTAALATTMAVYWVLDVLPRPVVGLFPLLVLPLLGTAPLHQVATAYTHPLLLLMAGGFVLAQGIEAVGLHERLLGHLLRPSWVRSSPRRVLGGLMVATAVLSALVSNSATAVMLLPVAQHLGRRVGGRQGEPAFVLGMAYAASIGGLMTLVGTPPNAVFAGVADELLGREVGFGTWMGVGVPAALGMLPAAWAVLVWGVFRVPATAETRVEAPVVPPWRPGERAVVGVVALAVALWLSRSTKDLGVVVLPGWEQLFQAKGYELDALVALGTGLLLFAWPGPLQRGPGLVRWPEVAQGLPWGVLLLMGGGFALAGAVRDAQWTSWVAGGAVHLQGLPTAVTTLVLATGVTFLTELTSNTATSQIVLPLLAEAAPAAGVDPMVWMVPVTLSSSCAFMLPVATPPNAIAAEAGGVSGTDMARAGVALNVLGAVFLTALSLTWVPWWLGGA